MIGTQHVPYLKEILALPDVLAEPAAVFGFHDIAIHPDHFKPRSALSAGARLRHAREQLRRRWRAALGTVHRDLELPSEFQARNLGQLLEGRSIKDVSVIDLFDPRADLRWDMNLPIPESAWERYGTFIDLGSLEHVFDVRQCVENSLRMVRPGGTYVLGTPVTGHFRHGFYTFNPEALLQAVRLNGFELLYQRYATRRGAPLDDPGKADNSLIWLAARKVASVGKFVVPQQGGWPETYASKTAPVPLA